MFRLANSAALNVDGVNGVAVMKGGLPKKPDGSGLVPHAARPCTMGGVVTAPASQLLAVVPAVDRSLITSALGLGNKTGLSPSKSRHTDSDARPLGVIKQLQQATSIAQWALGWLILWFREV